MTEDVRAEPEDTATGLGADSERLYRVLLSKADASVAQLAAESGLSASDVHRLLGELVDAGFATMTADSRYRAVAPDLVLGGRLASRLDAVRFGYEALRELLEIHRTGPGRGGRDDRGRWEQVTGAVAIQSRLTQLRDTAERCVRTFVKPPMVLPLPDGAQHRELQARGVGYRLLFDRSVLDADGEGAYLRQHLDWSDEIRFAKRLPLKLLVIDDRATIIEDPGSDKPRALITANESIVRLTAELFEQLWETAIPSRSGPRERAGAGLDDDDALLLSLLIAGLTDQSIASKLGIGLRTVQRRVRDLMDLAEVDTRIQLGWHAAKRGWVS
ncbi:TrmB family transcriptional regulator [Glycomyces tenuis]|uniref:TrmB family transcriptional regulator n=1 Tax=Glycomyces tenuis TaxID=58116 RepID=UPI0003FD11CC|nr:winged helix-turn-helix transcriptional regulator [Glycomyces tenuis]